MHGQDSLRTTLPLARTRQKIDRRLPSARKCLLEPFNCVLGKMFRKTPSPSFSTVSLSAILPRFTFCSQNHLILAAECLVRGVNFGGKVFAKMKDLESFSGTETLSKNSPVEIPTAPPRALVVSNMETQLYVTLQIFCHLFFHTREGCLCLKLTYFQNALMFIISAILFDKKNTI